MADELKEGTIVVHPTLGYGKILMIEPGSAWVFFKSVEGEPKDAVKRLSLAVAKLTAAAEQSDPALDNLPPMVQGGKIVPPARIRLTEAQAVNMFVGSMRSFEDAEYLRRERDYKWEAHEKTVAELVSRSGHRLAAADPASSLPRLLLGLFGKTNLLSTRELIRLSAAFKTAGAAQSMAVALLAFIDGPTHVTFDKLVDAVGALPAEPGRSVLTWPVVSLLPFLAEPKRHMFLKPKVTQRVAEVFMFDLLYDSRPSWTTYQRLLTLSDLLLNRLRPLGARDFIDVQSFMWVIEGVAYMKKTKQVRAR